MTRKASLKKEWIRESPTGETFPSLWKASRGVCGQRKCHLQTSCAKENLGLLVILESGELGKGWHEMLLEGGQGQITLGFVSHVKHLDYILRDMGIHWRILRRGETWSEYSLYARLRGRVTTCSLLPRTVPASSCHPGIIINNVPFTMESDLA